MVERPTFLDCWSFDREKKPVILAVLPKRVNEGENNVIIKDIYLITHVNNTFPILDDIRAV